MIVLAVTKMFRCMNETTRSQVSATHFASCMPAKFIRAPALPRAHAALFSHAKHVHY